MPAMESCSTTKARCVEKPCYTENYTRPHTLKLNLQIACSWKSGLITGWGHARDYVEMQWLMLQQEQAEIMSLPPCITVCVILAAAAESRHPDVLERIKVGEKISDAAENVWIRAISGRPR